MSVRIEINPQVVGAKVKTAWEKGLFALSSQILGDCNNFVKIDTHTMEGTSYIKSELGKGLLVWDTPYAKRQYWEIKTSLTPGRTFKWCQTAKNSHLADWKKMAEKGLRENL